MTLFYLHSLTHLFIYAFTDSLISVQSIPRNHLDPETQWASTSILNSIPLQGITRSLFNGPQSLGFNHTSWFIYPRTTHHWSKFNIPFLHLFIYTLFIDYWLFHSRLHWLKKINPHESQTPGTRPLNSAKSSLQTHFPQS